MSPEMRRAAKRLQSVCDDLDMRHNGTGSLHYSECSQLLDQHRSELMKLPRQWAMPHADEFVCTRTLRLCEPGDGRKMEL